MNIKSSDHDFKILVIEDSEISLEMLESLLKGIGYEVLIASDGVTGRKIANEQQPHLIILDIEMPGENGYETLQKLKDDPTTEDIPIIFVSGLTDIADKVNGFELGAVDFITKPYEPIEVEMRVKVHLKLSLSGKAIIENQKHKLQQLATTQGQMLVTPDRIPAAKFAAKYIPLEEAGGDFYAVNTVGERIYGYFLGDISGHDISTSYLTAALNALLRQNCTALNTPMEAMGIINNVLYDIFEGKGRFLAASYLALNRANQTASFINMGNPPLLVVAPNKPARMIFSRGMPLGIFEKTTFSVFKFPISKGERFYLLTDGLLEVGGSVWTSSTDRLLDVVEELRGYSLEESVERLCEALIPNHTEINDDIACLATEV